MDVRNAVFKTVCGALLRRPGWVRFPSIPAKFVRRDSQDDSHSGTQENIGRNLTGIVGTLGGAILRVPEPQVERTTDQMKLLLWRDTELNLATGMVALALLGFLITIGLGSLTHWLWETGKPGASLGLFVTVAALAGVILHWTRSKVIERRISRLDAGKVVARPNVESFWVRSSDSDFILLFAIGVIIAVLAYRSLK